MIRALLLYTSAGGGHRAAANAIAAELRTLPGATVEVRDVLEFAPKWFAYGQAWSLLQRHGTHAWDWFFDTTEKGAIDLDPVRLPLNAALLAELDRYVAVLRPTHIVCTHYLPALAVARVAPAIGARTVLTITDHLAHRAWLVPGIDAICVTDAAMARALRGRTSAELVVTGIPISSACAASVRAVSASLPRARVLAVLGSVPRRDALAAIEQLATFAYPATHSSLSLWSTLSLAPTLTSLSSRAAALGVGRRTPDAFPAVEELAALPLAGRVVSPSIAPRHDLEVLCGDDDEVLAYARSRLPGARIAARTDRMIAALDSADLVISKAGGLLVSECLARGRAMVLPFAAPGQERGNARYAVTAGAAVRVELSALADTLGDLVEAPGALRRMSAHARRAAHPDAAAAVVATLIGISQELRHAA